MWNRHSWKSRWFLLASVSFFLVMAAGGTVLLLERDAQEAKPVSAAQEVNILLKKSYVCGTEEEQHVKKTVPSAEQVFVDYKDWELVSRHGNSFVFKKKVQDISPLCKTNGYFGLSKDGVLTLFDGPPMNEKVIQTFFQMDTKKIESSLPVTELQILHKGIRIHDISEYNSILSTYGEFANWTKRAQMPVDIQD